MEKTIGTIIDELCVTNNKIFYLIDKVQKNEHTKEHAGKIQTLNKYRSELTNEINRFYGEREDVKV